MAKRRKKRRKIRRDTMILCGIYGIVLLLILVGALVVSRHVTITTSDGQTAAEAKSSTESSEAASKTEESETSQTEGSRIPAVSDVIESSQSSESSEASETSEADEAKSAVAAEEVDETEDAQPDDGKTRILISAAGDVTLGKDSKSAYDTSLPAYYEKNGPEYFFKGVKDVFSADDLTIVNFEGTLTTATTAYNSEFSFKADPEYVDCLTDGSIEACSISNNHSHDYGEQGFTDTQKYLSDAGISWFGYENTATREVKGKKVVMVGAYFLKSRDAAIAQMKEQVTQAKSDGADLVIVTCHWGGEKETQPRTYQKEVAHIAIDAGADLVLGTHAHVIQGVEVYKNRYICYGLANFCFGGNKNPKDKDTFIYQQTFTFDTSGKLETPTESDVNYIPCRVSSVTDYNDYQPTILTGDEADEVLEKIKTRSEGLSQ